MSQNQSHPTDEVLYPEHITRDSLYALFVSAYLNVNRDPDGDVYLKENFTSWVFPQQDGEQIRLMVQFKANADAARTAKLEYVNGINDGLKLLRAYVDEDEDIGFDYFIAIEGGITKRNIVLSVRRFINYVQTALQRDEQSVIS